MRVVAKTDRGRVRENNEDYYIVDEEINLFIVADGVGGCRGGEVASRLAAETIRQVIRERLIKPGNHNRNIEAIIQEAINCAHGTIVNEAADDPSLSSMGTTIVLGLLQGETLYVAHVGDSRALLVNAQQISLLTEDHSVVMDLISEGKISWEDAKHHEMRHVITQCLGCAKYLGPEIKKFDFNKDDILLLCSDGLTDMVEDYEIKQMIVEKGGNLEQVADALPKLANSRGGRDNITLVLVECYDYLN